MRVSIALATYNGERFLGAQLASLARQTWQPYELIVTDDNSSDTTLKIVANFASTSPFPVKLSSNSGRLGFAENFMHASSVCTGDAIAFCDQDDVWHEDKLARCVVELEARDVALVFHQYVNTDENLRPVGSLIPRNSTSIVFERSRADKDLMWATGCAMLVKQEVIKELIRCWPEDHLKKVRENGRSILAHDSAAFYVANGMGKISYVAEPLVWHRIHENNTCTVNPAFRHSVKRAVQMGITEYRERSSLIRAQVEMYEYMAARAQGEVAKSLFELVRKLRCLSEMNEARSRLYGSRSALHRMAAILKMIRAGVYSNLDGRSGTRALLADMAFTILPRMFAHSTIVAEN